MNIILDFKRVAMLACVAALSVFQLFAQSSQNIQGSQNSQEVKFRYPLDVTMSLSGNYGELRSNHFHGGVDFRVGGVVGAPIYAAERGYISRITIGPSGYGNAIYITHPNGYVTVYGHMHCFADHIAEYVRDKQYEKESFRQDLSFTPEQFPVKKGEYIGKAGNTGSSGGPHLHFEIRDENNVNTDAFGRGYLKITDNLPPTFRSVVFYGIHNRGGVPESYYIGMPKEGYITLPEHSYICIDAVDKQEGTNARLAVSEYKVWLDTDLIYHFTLGEVPGNMGRDINSLIEFKQKVVRGKTYVKSYVEPGNLLQDRIKHSNRGVISLNDTLKHKVKVEVKDIAGNKASKIYTVKRNDALSAAVKADSSQVNFAGWFFHNFYIDKGLKLYIPQGTLYNSIDLKVDTLPVRITPYAPVWNIASDRIAMRRSASISLECNLPDSLISKAFVAHVYGEGHLGYAGGKYDSLKKEITANVLSLGKFTVGVDLQAPQITATIANNAIVKGNSIVFRLRDNLSGIKNYRVEIDGHWVLAEHDAKTRRIIIPLQYAKIKRGGKHKLVFKAEDNCGNVSKMERVFTW